MKRKFLTVVRRFWKHIALCMLLFAGKMSAQEVSTVLLSDRCVENNLRFIN
ncbi:MAG: hypothetical protein LBH19_07185 [Dysgonamonadaceae bacterium]|jgi:hypothetical protein|nr:hypothetical protein [Dysgonamonadaceae bacterium]